LARGSVPSPHKCTAIEFRPDRNDSGRGIPAPQPLVFSRARILRLHHNRSLAEGAFSEITNLQPTDYRNATIRAAAATSAKATTAPP
jgi:hypothetical protein